VQRKPQIFEGIKSKKQNLYQIFSNNSNCKDELMILLQGKLNQGNNAGAEADHALNQKNKTKLVNIRLSRNRKLSLYLRRNRLSWIHLQGDWK